MDLEENGTQIDGDGLRDRRRPGFRSSLGLRLTAIPVLFSVFILIVVALVWSLYQRDLDLRTNERALVIKLEELRAIELPLRDLRSELSMAMIWHISDSSGIKSEQALKSARDLLTEIRERTETTEFTASSVGIDGKSLEERITHISELMELSYTNFIKIPFIAAGNLRSLELQLNYLTYDLTSTRNALSADIERQATDLAEYYKKALFWIVVGLIVFLGFGWILSRLVIRSILSPLEVLENCIDEISNGKTNVPVPALDRRNVLGSIAEAIRNLDASKKSERLAMNRLVEAEKLSSLGGMVAGVAHEINTPIGIAVTAASHLQDESRGIAKAFEENTLSKSRLAKYLTDSDENSGLILNSTMRASDLIRSFKQVAVDQSSHITRDFDLQELAQQVGFSFTQQLRQKGVTFVNEIPDGLRLSSDPGIYSQIFTNLVANSLLHGFDGVESGTITVSAKYAAEKLSIQFYDDGQGMDEETRDRLFEPFFTTKRNAGGTGLGMSIVYNLVAQNLGGQISVLSQVGIGTQFSIELPDARPVAAGQSAA